MRRTHPSRDFPTLSVIGYVTLTESGCLTHALIRDLGSVLYLHGGNMELEMVPLAAELEVGHERPPACYSERCGTGCTRPAPSPR